MVRQFAACWEQIRQLEARLLRFEDPEEAHESAGAARLRGILDDQQIPSSICQQRGQKARQVGRCRDELRAARELTPRGDDGVSDRAQKTLDAHLCQDLLTMPEGCGGLAELGRDGIECVRRESRVPEARKLAPSPAGPTRGVDEPPAGSRRQLPRLGERSHGVDVVTHPRHQSCEPSGRMPTEVFRAPRGPARLIESGAGLVEPALKQGVRRFLHVVSSVGKGREIQTHPYRVDNEDRQDGENPDLPPRAAPMARGPARITGIVRRQHSRAGYRVIVRETRRPEMRGFFLRTPLGGLHLPVFWHYSGVVRPSGEVLACVRFLDTP